MAAPIKGQNMTLTQARAILELAAGKIQQIIDSHKHDTQECDDGGCDFVASWETAVEILRDIPDAELEAVLPKQEAVALAQIGGNRLDISLAEFTTRAQHLIREEQEKPMPNNALISVLCDAVRLARENEILATAPTAPALPKQDRQQIVTDEMVDRFLAWPLPESVCADLCATNPGYSNRTGTNLLSAIEAKQMLEYVLKDNHDQT